MEAEHCSDMLVPNIVYWATWHHSPEGCNLRKVYQLQTLYLYIYFDSIIIFRPSHSYVNHYIIWLKQLFWEPSCYLKCFQWWSQFSSLEELSYHLFLSPSILSDNLQPLQSEGNWLRQWKTVMHYFTDFTVRASDFFCQLRVYFVSHFGLFHLSCTHVLICIYCSKQEWFNCVVLLLWL